MTGRTRHLRRQRGQSLIETTLGLIVFVTVLLFGIYFAEIGFLVQKAQEAANWAVWQPTGLVMNEKSQSGLSFNAWQTNVANVGALTKQRYDQELLAGGAYNQQVIARTQPFTVSCTTSDVIGPAASIRPADATFSSSWTSTLGPFMAWPGARTNPSIACNVGLEILPMGMPEFFLEDRFKVQHSNRTNPLRLCAFGSRASDGSCGARLSVLLDDWGLMRPEEGRECPLDSNYVQTRATGVGCPSGNRAYFYLVHTAFKEFNRQYHGTENPSGGSALARYSAGYSPIEEGRFFMSFRGIEAPTPYAERFNGAHMAQQTWETTPWEHPSSRYRQAHGQRTNHFMGIQNWWIP